jgi:hypothetical protein
MRKKLSFFPRVRKSSFCNEVRFFVADETRMVTDDQDGLTTKKSFTAETKTRIRFFSHLRAKNSEFFSCPTLVCLADKQKRSRERMTDANASSDT